MNRMSIPTYVLLMNFLPARSRCDALSIQMFRVDKIGNCWYFPRITQCSVLSIVKLGLQFDHVLVAALCAFVRVRNARSGQAGRPARAGLAFSRSLAISCADHPSARLYRRDVCALEIFTPSWTLYTCARARVCAESAWLRVLQIDFRAMDDAGISLRE